MRFAEVTEGDRSIHSGNDLAQMDLLWGAGEGVTTPDSALGTDKTRSFESQEYLLEVGLGKSGALGDVFHRSRTGVGTMEGQRQQCSAGVITSGRHSHGFIVGAAVTGHLLWRYS